MPLRIEGPSHLSEPWDTLVVSPWYGISAILNFILFVAMGTAIPFLLTDGSLKTPIVRSTATQDCLERAFHVGDYLAHPPKSEAIFQQCLNALDQGCDTQFYLTPPKITSKRLDSCPFDLNICMNNTQPLEITHWNITPYELGINSKSTLSLTHRLTCTPVNLASFTVLPSNKNHSFVSAQDRNFAYKNGFQPSLTLQLDTWNGPHQYSNTSSGLWRARQDGLPDLTILPKYMRPLGQNPWKNETLMNKLLQRSDGRSYLVIFRAAAISSAKEINDPYFAAHQRIEGKAVFYADYEATGIGCVEQFQYCAKMTSLGVYCTPWMEQNKSPKELLQRLNETKRLDDLADLLVVYRAGLSEGIGGYGDLKQGFLAVSNGSPPTLYSVFSYLGNLIENFHAAPLQFAETPREVKAGNLTDQWVTEVELWFMKTILQSIITTQSGAQTALVDRRNLPKNFSASPSLCDRILFRDGDYTNINWIGYWTVISALTIICLSSFLRAPLYTQQRWSGAWKTVLCSITSKFRRGRVNNIDSIDQQSQRRLPQVFGRRTWYTGGTRGSGGNRIDVYQMQPTQGYSDSEQRDRIWRYEDIDGVI